MHEGSIRAIPGDTQHVAAVVRFGPVGRSGARDLELEGSGRAAVSQSVGAGAGVRTVNYTEHHIQCGVIRWARLQAATAPYLARLHAIPNGGRRNPREAVRLKAQGVTPGVPDLCLPRAAHGFHGLYMETKAPALPGKPGGRLSADQKDWQAYLTEEGYYAVVYDSIDKGIAYLRWYCDLGGNEHG